MVMHGVPASKFRKADIPKENRLGSNPPQGQLMPMHLATKVRVIADSGHRRRTIVYLQASFDRLLRNFIGMEWRELLLISVWLCLERSLFLLPKLRSLLSRWFYNSFNGHTVQINTQQFVAKRFSWVSWCRISNCWFVFHKVIGWRRFPSRHGSLSWLKIKKIQILFPKVIPSFNGRVNELLL